MGARLTAIAVALLLTLLQGSRRVWADDSTVIAPNPTGAASSAWNFEPARRGDKPISARIRVAIRFQEAATPIGQMSGPHGTGEGDAPRPGATADHPSGATAGVQEVRVRGAPAEPSRARITIQEAREVPGGLGDPLRAISALPGVSPMTSGTPYLYVRGAPPWNTGYLVDGVRVPLLFHAGVVTSVIAPELVKSVDFYPSAVPARYGGFSGGIIEERTSLPSVQPRAFASAKLYEASAIGETPFAEGRGSALAAVRYGYPGLVLAVVSPTKSIGYWDYQSRETWAFDERNRVALFAFGSHDRTSENGAETFASDFHRLDLRYEHDLAAGGRLLLGTTAGWSSAGAAPAYVDDWMWAARAEAELPLGEAALWRSGLQLQLDEYELSAGAGASGIPDSANPPPTNFTGGAYSDLVWQAGRLVEVTPGVRFDVYRSARANPAASGTVPAIEPRLGLRVRISPDTSWLSSVGLAHQYPNLRIGNSPASLAISGFASGDVHLQTSAQIAEGLELHLPAKITLTTTGFASSTHGMTDLPSTCYEQATGARAMPGPPSYLCADQPTNGLSYGLEVLLRRSLTERVTGWFSYTLSRATESYTQPGQAGTVLSPFDRTHVLSVIGAYDFGAHWRAGARLYLYSGTPYLQFSTAGQRFAPVEGYRFPPFVRLDVRLEKRWVLARERWLSLVFEIMNATLSRETDRLDCGLPYAAPGTCTASSSAPTTIPSVGLEAGF